MIVAVFAGSSRRLRTYPRQCQDATNRLVRADACCSNVCGSCRDFSCAELQHERALLRSACPTCASWVDFTSHCNLSAQCHAGRAHASHARPHTPAAVVQFFDQPLREAPPHVAASAEAWRLYAAHHGYSYELGSLADISPAAVRGHAGFPNWYGKLWLIAVAQRAAYRHARLLQVDMDTAPVRPRLPLEALVGGPLAPPHEVAISAEWGERSGGGRALRASSHVNTGIVYYANASRAASLWSEALRRVRSAARARGYGFGGLASHWPGDQGALSLLLRADVAAAAAVKVLPLACPLGTPWGDAVVHLTSGPVCPGPSCVRGWDPRRDRAAWLGAARDCVAAQLREAEGGAGGSWERCSAAPL